MERCERREETEKLSYEKLCDQGTDAGKKQHPLIKSKQAFKDRKQVLETVRAAD